MSDNPRIEELRRRVHADPASIAFAALAEEYRRVGNFKDAIETCLAGLKRHPSYLSAHVTLGRALIEVGRFDEAEQELQLVLKAAPENLAAIRGMAEIHHRRRDQGYDESQTLANLEHHEREEAANAAAAAAEASAPAAETVAPAAQPPAYEPPAFVAPALEAPTFEAPPLDPPGFQPPPYQPPAYQPAAYDPAAFDPAVLDAEPFDRLPAPPSSEPPPYEPPAYEPPAAPATAAYEAPHYDPPGTFDFQQVAAAAPAYQPAAWEISAAVAEQRSPQLDALERFLDAIAASRLTARAY